MLLPRLPCLWAHICAHTFIPSQYLHPAHATKAHRPRAHAVLAIACVYCKLLDKLTTPLYALHRLLAGSPGRRLHTRQHQDRPLRPLMGCPRLKAPRRIRCRGTYSPLGHRPGMGSAPAQAQALTRPGVRRTSRRAERGNVRGSASARRRPPRRDGMRRRMRTRVRSGIRTGTSSVQTPPLLVPGHRCLRTRRGCGRGHCLAAVRGTGTDNLLRGPACRRGRGRRSRPCLPRHMSRAGLVPGTTPIPPLTHLRLLHPTHKTRIICTDTSTHHLIPKPSPSETRAIPSLVKTRTRTLHIQATI